jgi:acetoacetate decarboxylase
VPLNEDTSDENTYADTWRRPKILKKDGDNRASSRTRPHRCPVADLPVLDVLGARHFVADLTLGLDEVVFDYLK